MPRLRHAQPKPVPIADQIEHRILRGDYLLTGLPTDRRLAIDLGVSRLTVRRALDLLVDRQLLQRGGNGRLSLSTGAEATHRPLVVGLLAPAFPGPFLQQVTLAAQHMADGRRVHLRPVDYVRWEDPVVEEALDRFDGVLLSLPSDPLPPRRIERLTQARAGVLSIGRDFSAHGIPSLVVHPPGSTSVLLDHLYDLGHRRIDYFNTQPVTGTPPRMDQWQQWCALHEIHGRVHNHPCESYGSPKHQAHARMADLLARGAFDATAIFAATELAAHGIHRALHEAGLRPGADVSLVTFGGDGMCRFQTPSITCMEHPDLRPYLRLFYTWLREGRGAWTGPLLMNPPDTLYRGETCLPPT